MCLLFVAAAFADDKSNFTGTWKQVGSPDRTYIDKIEHQGPNLKAVTTIADTPAKPSSLQRPLAGPFLEKTYSTDGTEQTSKDKQGRERWTTVFWQGPALVFLIVDKKDYRVTVTRETWTLSDAGKTLTKTRRVIGPDGLTQHESVLDKQ
jgi:hypothetical protein